jgi:hypothetical protein
VADGPASQSRHTQRRSHTFTVLRLAGTKDCCELVQANVRTENSYIFSEAKFFWSGPPFCRSCKHVPAVPGAITDSL